MFLTRTGLTKVLGMAVLGTAGLLGANTAQAGGFRLSFGIAPVVVALPVVYVQQPTYPTPVYAAPTYVPAYQPQTVIVEQPVPQPVYLAPAPVCAPPVVVYERPDWRRHEWRQDRDGFRFGYRR